MLASVDDYVSYRSICALCGLYINKEVYTGLTAHGIIFICPSCSDSLR